MKHGPGALFICTIAVEAKMFSNFCCMLIFLYPAFSANHCLLYMNSFIPAIFSDINFVVYFQTLAVLNPLKQTDHSIMQDTDLAGPLVFCLAFGGSLMLVSLFMLASI